MNLLFHYGALGDFILTLPLIRRLTRPITLLTTWQRGAVAGRMIDGITTMDIQMWEFMRLHSEGGPTSVSPAVGELFETADNIISFVSTGKDDWAINVARLSPQAKCIYIDPRPAEDFTNHITNWHAQQAQQQGLDLAPPKQPDTYANPDGPIVIHPGSGSPTKCWPADRFEELIDKLINNGRTVLPLLGETEVEHWPADQLERWRDQLGARILESIDQLHATLLDASAFIGNDSGPSHLAAQMGLPTVALFGPTNPTMWAPVGPAVTILAPPAPAEMNWLDVQTVTDACP